MKKVFVIGNQNHYASFLEGFELTDNSDEANLLILTGGSDVNPEAYGEEKHPTTVINLARDEEEFKVWHNIKAENPEVLTLGICRGSQLGCVLSGGKLVQHMSHPGMHKATMTDEDREITVSSTHHQMQYPFNLDESEYVMIAHCNLTKDSYAEGIPEGMKKPPVDPEIVFYSKTNILAVQGHPEMMPNSEFANEVNRLVKELVT